MMSRILSATFLCLLGLSVQARATPQVAAYYDGGMPVSEIPAAQINDLIYAFGEPNDAGVCIPVTAAQSATFAALRKLRQQHPGMRLIVSIGGWDAAPQYSDIALTGRSRSRFAASCIQAFLLKQGFDGIDIDWEFPVHGGMNRSRPVDRADATALVRELRGQLDVLGREKHRHYFLTVATPAGTWQQGGPYSVGDSYDLAALARSVDWLNVMTYDMNTIFSPLSAFNAPLAADPRDPTPQPARSLDNLTSAVRFYESRGVPAAKIMLGVAFYGRGFIGVSPQDAGLYSKYTKGYEETPWKTIRSQFLTSPDWVRHWSATAQAPWLYNATQHIFFTYDDPMSLGIKADFARREQLRGVMIWVLGEDDPGNGLLNALTSHLAPESPPQHASN
ncbi:MAG TPA: glycosyl hydrolase family 18 protein [Steroidobacteraceae bacterium]|nr:glycosyl hydrolase family 18 protein [Steroidobacteraceae bacterium]